MRDVHLELTVIPEDRLQLLGQLVVGLAGNEVDAVVRAGARALKLPEADRAASVVVGQTPPGLDARGLWSGALGLLDQLVIGHGGTPLGKLRRGSGG
jgi:hypothetical protein